MKPIDVLIRLGADIINDAAGSSESVHFHCLVCGKPKSYMFQDRWPYSIRCFGGGEHLATNLPALYAEVQGVTLWAARQQVAQFLRVEHELTRVVTRRIPEKAQDIQSVSCVPDGWVEIQKEDHIPQVQYLQRRGFSWNLVQTMRVMWPQNVWSPWVLFPVLEEGKIVSYEQRCTVSEKDWREPVDYRKTLCPWGVRNSNFLYGYDLAEPGTRLVLTEGIPNFYSLHQAGFNVVSTFGSSPQDRQIDLILSLEPDEVVLGFDGDRAGIRAVGKYRQRLRERVQDLKTTTWIMPGRRDHNDIHDPELLWRSFAQRRKQTIQAVAEIGAKRFRKP